MLKNRNPILLGCLLAGASLAPLAAQANPIVSMELTSFNGSTSLNQVYTEPYNALIGPQGLTDASQFTAANSIAATVYCDDFYDDVKPGDIWQATVTNMSALSSTSPLTGLMFGTTNALQQQQSYMAAAWIAEQIAGLDQSVSSQQMQAKWDSFALWYVFDPSDALTGLSPTDSAAALNEYNAALLAVANDTPSDFSNVNIYTPLDATPGSAKTQEFLTVNVPEPSTLSLAALGLLAVGFAVRRRRRHAAA